MGYEVHRVLEGIGKFADRKPTVDGKQYFQLVLYVPRDIARDSQFPFKPSELVYLKVEGEQLIVSKMRQKTGRS